MKRSTFYLFLILGTVQLYSQNNIAIQSFETSGDTWTPLTFSTPPCSIGKNVWDYSINIKDIDPSDGNQFWGIRDLDGSCGGSGFETITLSNINVTRFTSVVFSFDYYAKGFDKGEALKYELFYDNVSQGEVLVVEGEKGKKDDTKNWKTELVFIPASVANVSVKLFAKCNDDKEIAGFDNIKLYESTISNDFCNSATVLRVGNNNTENIVTRSNENTLDSGEQPDPGCAKYKGGDVWFTALVPASGALNIETLDAGGITDTGIAVYTGICGNLTLIDCDDKSGTGKFSLLEIVNLPNTKIFIRVWEKNNDSFGDFNIVAYSPLCPFSITWNGSNWSNIFGPNEFTSVIIDKNYNTSKNGSFESCNCTINAGSTLNVSSNNYILIKNNLSVNGNLEVQHEGSLVMIDDKGTINSTGTINIHKTTSPYNQYDYIYWSSPTTNETVGSALASSEPSRIYQWNNINGWSAANSTTVMDQGIGIIAMGPTTGTYPQTQSVIFDGLPNTGIIETPIVKNPDPLYTYLDWNLIGNPYPSALDASSFLDDPLNSSVVNGTVYLWTHNTEISRANVGSHSYNYSSNDYASFTSGTGGVAARSGGSASHGFIASGQGFFIQAASNGNVTFNNSMRAIGNNDQFYKATKIEEEEDRIWLNLSNDKGAFSQILIGFIDGATDGIDRSFDGPKFGGSHISFYSIIDEKNFVIQGRSHIKEEEKIKLGLYSYIEQNDDLKISIDKIEGNLSEYEIYLTDKLLNIVHDLKDESYTFIPEEKGVFNERFELFFAKSGTLSLEESSVTNEDLIIINNENHIQISTSNGTNISKLKVYNILGQDIANLYPNKNKAKIQTKNLPEGTVLILNATLENNMIITKKFLVY